MRGGRRLRAPRGREIRPTTDRVKEAVYSILQSRGSLDGLTVLDLFAGTGGLGIEALSRGASAAVFVDSSRAATEVIRANLSAAGFAGEVMGMPVVRAITQLEHGGRRFGGVFLDPPYGQGEIVPTLERLGSAAVVEDAGWIVAEHGRDEAVPERVGVFVRRLHRCYGDTWIALLTNERMAETSHGNPE